MTSGLWRVVYERQAADRFRNSLKKGKAVIPQDVDKLHIEFKRAPSKTVVRRPRLLNGAVYFEIECPWPIPPSDVIAQAVAQCVDAWRKKGAAVL